MASTAIILRRDRIRVGTLSLSLVEEASVIYGILVHPSHNHSKLKAYVLQGLKHKRCDLLIHRRDQEPLTHWPPGHFQVKGLEAIKMCSSLQLLHPLWAIRVIGFALGSKVVEALGTVLQSSSMALSALRSHLRNRGLMMVIRKAHRADHSGKRSGGLGSGRPNIVPFAKGVAFTSLYDPTLYLTAPSAGQRGQPCGPPARPQARRSRTP